MLPRRRSRLGRSILGSDRLSLSAGAETAATATLPDGPP
jgi:hypothetical protein